jgi:hypothetical protein
MSAANTGEVTEYLVDGQDLEMVGTGTGAITAVLSIHWI